jgi:helix-turn-helix protein
MGRYKLPSQLSVKELAAYLRVSLSTVYRLLRSGELLESDLRFKNEILYLLPKLRNLQRCVGENPYTHKSSYDRCPDDCEACAWEYENR